MIFHYTYFHTDDRWNSNLIYKSKTLIVTIYFFTNGFTRNPRMFYDTGSEHNYWGDHIKLKTEIGSETGTVTVIGTKQGSRYRNSYGNRIIIRKMYRNGKKINKSKRCRKRKKIKATGRRAWTVTGAGFRSGTRIDRTRFWKKNIYWNRKRHRNKYEKLSHI